MRYRDILYGEIEIPEEVWRLFAYPELVRLRGISQAVLPVEMNPFATAVNRFQHGIGVWHLAGRLCRRSEFVHLAPDLPLAGLLQDAANPPFSHTGDWFMREAVGHDGETRLAELLGGSELATALRNLGADPERICAFVAGEAKPWSLLLNGSLDLDNADNVARYNAARGTSEAAYDPEAIADAFRLTPGGDGIAINFTAVRHVLAWQRARALVYRDVYAEPHLSLAMMLHRAVELAYLAKELLPGFWSFTDLEAIQRLKRCNAGSRALTRHVCAMQPYRLCAEWTGTESLGFDWRNWRIRKAVADAAAEAAGLEPWEAAAYLGIGRDTRNIELPMKQSNWTLVPFPAPPQEPIHRIRIYLRRSPRDAGRLLFRDLTTFCRSAIQDRMAIAPEGLAEAAGRPAGF